MSQEVLVHLVFDPYRIYAGDGQRVTTLPEELAAFRTVGALLCQDLDSATRQPRTYVLNRTAWEHFRSLRSVRGSDARKYTPRRELQALLGAEPPAWLTNEAILAWNMLRRTAPSTLVPEGWAATVASWLLPGIAEARLLACNWLSAAASVHRSRAFQCSRGRGMAG